MHDLDRRVHVHGGVGEVIVIGHTGNVRVFKLLVGQRIRVGALPLSAVQCLVAARGSAEGSELAARLQSALPAIKTESKKSDRFDDVTKNSLLSPALRHITSPSV